MKTIVRIAVAFMIILLANVVPVDASGRGRGHGGGHGRHGGVHFGLFLGPGVWGPGWWGPYRYPYYPYYPPPAVIVQPPREEYVVPPAETEPPQYWYYCPDPQGYYPYIAKCPKGWLKVVPPDSPPDEEE